MIGCVITVNSVTRGLAPLLCKFNASLCIVVVVAQARLEGVLLVL